MRIRNHIDKEKICIRFTIDNETILKHLVSIQTTRCCFIEITEDDSFVITKRNKRYVQFFLPPCFFRLRYHKRIMLIWNMFMLQETKKWRPGNHVT